MILSSLKPILQILSVPAAKSLGLGAASSIWRRSMVVHLLTSVLEMKEKKYMYTHTHAHIFFSRMC